MIAGEQVVQREIAGEHLGFSRDDDWPVMKCITDIE